MINESGGVFMYEPSRDTCARTRGSCRGAFADAVKLDDQKRLSGASVLVVCLAWSAGTGRVGAAELPRACWGNREDVISVQVVICDEQPAQRTTFALLSGNPGRGPWSNRDSRWW